MADEDKIIKETFVLNELVKYVLRFVVEKVLLDLSHFHWVLTMVAQSY